MIESLLYLLIYILVIGIVLGLILWLNDQFVPQPMHRFVRIAVFVIAALVVIFMLLGLVGHSPRLGRL